MKCFTATIVLFSVLASAQSYAWVGQQAKYNCKDSKGNKLSVILDTDKQALILVGQFKGENFNFSVKGEFKNGVSTYSDSASGIVAKVQEAGPYDGGQDSLWGALSKGSEKSVLTCFIGMGDD